MAQQDYLREQTLGRDTNKLPYPRWNQFSPTPINGNKYYQTCNITDSKGEQVGWNAGLYGSKLPHAFNSYSVLPNCVGYAFGRFAEIIGQKNGLIKNSSGQTVLRYAWSGDPGESWLSAARQFGLKVSTDPKQPAVGAMIVFKGHVEIVEEIVDSNTIYCSASGYNWYDSNSNNWPVRKEIRHKSNNWVPGKYWSGQPSSKYFIGFIYNPIVSFTVPADTGGAISEQDVPRVSAEYLSTTYQNVTENTEVDSIRTAEYSGQLQRTKSTGLLSVPTYVEAPFVTVKVGDYILGTYTKDKLNTGGTQVQYPNFVNGLTVKKINGAVNQYTINILYQIQPGQDPNLIDKMFSSISQSRLIYITYGDWNSPTFIYKEEEALITNITTRVEFGSSRIEYTVYAVSTSAKVFGQSEYFSATRDKPSNVILNLLYSNKFGLLDLFYGMKDRSKVMMQNLIATDDQVVDIEEKRGIDPLSYLNYLVTCMIPQVDTDTTNPLNSASYYMSIQDDIYSEFGGPYFKVTEVKSDTKTLHLANVYEVDVGFPSENMVESFNINEDQLWSILYNYSSEIDASNYSYNIDNNGNVITEFSPSIMTSLKKNRVTASQKTWWTQMTQFPISATITIKGLVRPAMLMTYLRINAMFYGQRHISSGLYVITGQEDSVNARGYRTTLTLQRVAGDEDYITKEMRTVTRSYPVLNKKTVNNKGTYKPNLKQINWTDTSENANKAARETARNISSSLRNMKDNGGYSESQLSKLENVNSYPEFYNTLMEINPGWILN